MDGRITDEERVRNNLRLKVGFVLLVVVSAVGITLQIDPSAVQLGGAAVGGLAIGIVLSWYVSRTLREFRQARRR